MSLEMPNLQIRQRLLAAHSGVPLPRIMRPEGTELLPHVDALATLPIGLRDAVGGDTLTVERIGAIVHGYKRKGDTALPLLVVVDYLQLVRSRERFERRHELVGHVMRELKAIALREGVPIVVGAQVSRNAEQRGKESRPIMADLAESSDIEKNADKIVLMHRPMGEADTDLIVAKDRMGETFLCDATFVGPLCLFTDRAPQGVVGEWQ
jgi:replicative DNA helicase